MRIVLVLTNERLAMRIAMETHWVKTEAERLALWAKGLCVEILPRKAQVHRVAPPDVQNKRFVPRNNEPHDDNPPED